MRDDNNIYIVMVNDRPYGYFTNENDIDIQLSSIKKTVIPKFEFHKNFFWNEIMSDDEDVISKWKCISVDKNDFTRYENIECVLEIVKTSLIENENISTDVESDYED